MTRGHAFRVTEPPEVVAAMAGYSAKDHPHLRERFSVTSRFGKPVDMWREGSDKIWLPRAFCPDPTPETDKRSRGLRVDIASRFEPKNDEQARVVEESTDLLARGVSHIVRCPPGFGKTACSLAVAAEMGMTVLIAVTKGHLIRQWADEVTRFMGVHPHDVGLARGNKFDAQGKKVVIGTIHSLCKRDRYPSWFYRWPGLVVWDEVHHLSADTFQESACLFESWLRLGLSATPRRADGMAPLFEGHIGRVRVSSEGLILTPKVLRYRTDFKLPRVKKRGALPQERPVPLPHSAGRCGHVTKILVRNTARNRMIAHLMAIAGAKGRRVVLLSDAKEQLHTVADMLARYEGVPRSDVGFYVHGRSDDELATASRARYVHATYGMLGEASNVPWLDTAIMGSPRSDVEQIVGRLFREWPDKPQPVVFDLVDMDSHVYAGYARRRMEYYRSINAEVVDVRP